LALCILAAGAFAFSRGVVEPANAAEIPATRTAAESVARVPVLKPYSFAMVQKKLVIVNPGNRKIANVIAH